MIIYNVTDSGDIYTVILRSATREEVVSELRDEFRHTVLLGRFLPLSHLIRVLKRKYKEIGITLIVE